MAEVKVLIQGFETADEKACATVSLVRDKDIVMVCDPGTLDNQQILIDALAKEGLRVNDVNFVFITHSHIDHYRNIGMFPNAKTLEYFGIWEGSKSEDWKEQFSEDIKVIKTPGHSYDGLTLLIQTKEGTVAVCGDVFWKENYPEKDRYASDLEKLEESRKKVLKVADFIIPGHAGIYKNK